MESQQVLLLNKGPSFILTCIDVTQFELLRDFDLFFRAQDMIALKTYTEISQIEQGYNNDNIIIPTW